MTTVLEVRTAVAAPVTVWRVYVSSPWHHLADGICVGECDLHADAVAIRDEAELIHADGISEGSLHVGIVQVTR